VDAGFQQFQKTVRYSLEVDESGMLSPWIDSAMGKQATKAASDLSKIPKHHKTQGIVDGHQCTQVYLN